MARRIPARVPLMLFLLFFFGFVVAALAFVDIHWSHWVFAPSARTAPAHSSALPSASPEVL